MTMTAITRHAMHAGQTRSGRHVPEAKLGNPARVRNPRIELAHLLRNPAEDEQTPSVTIKEGILA